MSSESVDSSASPPLNGANVQTLDGTGQDKSTTDTPSILSASGISSWARRLRIPEDSQIGNDAKANFARFTNGIGLLISPKNLTPDQNAENTTTAETSVLGSFKKGLVDSSRSAVKAVQVKARHIVSQNKRRYQEGGFDLDMTYITENIIAMGFPAGDMSSGFLGYIEGFYRNHMEDVIKFFETNHKGKYKVYNLCSERLYDASLFKGKVASFPFDDNNCPPIELILSFCQSAYQWLKEDIENVVVVHCKAGIARTGLMISSLLLFVKFFPQAEESINHFNQKRCLDGRGLVLPSQIRYVRYFERMLTKCNGETPPERRCKIRGLRLHKCPFWIRPSITISNHKGVLFSTEKHPKTRNLMPEDFWIKAPKRGVVFFALPGEPALTDVAGDFKIHFHDGQGDFYCWLNTTMMENKKILNASELDGFDKRKLPSPGFQVEVVLIDGSIPIRSKTKTSNESGGNLSTPASNNGTSPTSNQDKTSGDEDDVFSDSESEEDGSTRRKKAQETPSERPATGANVRSKGAATEEEMEAVTHGTRHISLSNTATQTPGSEPRSTSNIEVAKLDCMGRSDFKAIGADASVFSFGDEEDSESE